MTQHNKKTRETQLSRRLRRAINQEAHELIKKDPNLGRVKALKTARQIVIARERKNPHRKRIRELTEPELRAVKRSETCSVAEQRAIRKIPAIQWLVAYLLTAGRTRPFLNRLLVTAALFEMAFTVRPEFRFVFSRFRSGDSINWAHGSPQGPFTIEANYHALRKVTDCGKSGATIHINLDLLDQIAATKVAGELRFPNFGRFCAIDGTLIEANVPQTLPRMRSPRARKTLIREIAGKHRRMADMVFHGFGKHSDAIDDQPEPGLTIRKRCFGYNLVVISCLDTCLPVIWTLMPATGNEVAAARELIEALFKLRPEFPMEYLVGDGLYNRGFEFPSTLYKNYGIHLVSPRTNRKSKSEWADSDGVPRCAHGLMKFTRHGEVWDAAKRRAHGIRPGNLPPNGKGLNPRLRFECHEEVCREKSTRMEDDWILHTFLPHIGQDKWTALREVLLARRNTSESLFAQLKQLGVGAKWPNRARWATDNGMRWLTSLALLNMTARKLVHLDGSYAAALKDAYSAGIITRQQMHRFLEVEGIETDSRSRADDTPPVAPSTWNDWIELPIDREFLVTPVDAYSDIPYGSNKSEK